MVGLHPNNQSNEGQRSNKSAFDKIFMFSTLWHGMSFLEAVAFWVEIQLMRSDCVLDPTSFRNLLVSRYSSGQKKYVLINMDD